MTEADLREEAERRAISTIPEVFDRGYDVGHVDFTHRGYALYRQVIQEIHGDDFLLVQMLDSTLIRMRAVSTSMP